MSIFDQQRLTNKVFKIDIKRMRRGWYSDKYFENIGIMMDRLNRENYKYTCSSNRQQESNFAGIRVGELMFVFGDTSPSRSYPSEPGKLIPSCN